MLAHRAIKTFPSWIKVLKCTCELFWMAPIVSFDVLDEFPFYTVVYTLVNRALGGEGSQNPKPLEASYTHT